MSDLPPVLHDVKSLDPRGLWEQVLDFYRRQGRDLPWRQDHSPYNVLVSEIMLQQTQVSRVLPAYLRFIQELPDMEALAAVSTARLLELWRGLGYNRRALALRDTAIQICSGFSGQLPADAAVLQGFKGIGPNTAASICVFAFNRPLVFIETNIRRFFIHYFFEDQSPVEDKQILPLVGQTLPPNRPRDWYNALMDIGSLIPAKVTNPNRRSASYKKQSPFTGSLRQIRGEILKSAGTGPRALNDLAAENPVLADRSYSDLKKAADQLVKEGFLNADGDLYQIAD